MTERAAARAYQRLARIFSMWPLAVAACLTLAALLVPATAFAVPLGAPLHAKPTAAAPADNRGWSNPRALELAKEAIEAKKAGNAQLCVEKDQASLQLEDHPYVKLHLASCLSATGKLVDALGKAKDSLGAGIRNGDEDLQRSAQARVSELLPRISHVKLLLPKESSGIKVTFDGIPVRQALFKQRIAVDPGDHIIDAERDNKGDHELFKERITLAEGEEKTIEIVLKPTNATQSEIECLQNATSYDEKLACVERKSTKPNVHIGLEGSGYTDSTNVHVFSPAINASVVSPTQGWNVGASYLIDFVSAASPDIVSMASPAYKEVRHAVAAGGGYKVGAADLSVNGFLGSEPDYLSRSVGGAVATELNDKLITPRIGYNFSSDRIGIRNTPFAQFERNLTTHEVEAGITFVMSPTTLLVTGITGQFEIGENAKLYRYIPMFAPDIASRIPVGATIDLVNQYRLPMRPLEQLPTERDRYALGLRLAKRFNNLNSTLRLDQRLYYDTWGIAATTTDARYVQDVGKRFRFWPHLRLNAQTGASFYQLAYAALLNSDGSITVPLYRSDDRELGPLVTLTAGGGLRFGLTPPDSKTQIGLNVAGDLMYTRFFDALFVTTRTAAYGTVGIDFEWD